MIYVDVEPEEWARRINMKIQQMNCAKCKILVDVNIPMAMKGYRGFTSKDHGCGEGYMIASLKPWDKEEIEFWNRVI